MSCESGVNIVLYRKLLKGGAFMLLSDSQTKRLLEYKGTPQIKQLSLNMAYGRLQRMYLANPSSLSQCTQEFNTLFKRYAAIMEVDYRWITGL
jgi:hypothetical protein